MGGGKGGSKAPDPIDPGQSAGEFLFGKDFNSYGGITDPRLQNRLIDAERRYRPEYTAVDLSNQEQFLFGVPGTEKNPNYEPLQNEIADLEQQLRGTSRKVRTTVANRGRSGRLGSRSSRFKTNPEYTELNDLLNAKRSELAGMKPGGTEAQAGLLDILGRATPEIGKIQSDSASYQRDRDIEDVTRLLPEVMQAQREADPSQYALYDSLMDQAQSEVDRGGRLSPEERRMAVQTAAESGQARGRGLDNSTMFAEALNRQQFSDAREDRARGFGQSMLQAGEMVNADPFLTILGRPSGASQMAQGQQLMGNQMMNNLGPALFDPNTGLNMAMANQANQTNYNAAKEGAAGSMMGGLFSGLGSLGSGLAIGGMFSDRRLKWDVQRVGTHPLGIGLYSYRYKGSTGRHLGVIAQEVQRVKPQAVGECAGFLTVDYDQL